MFEDLYRTEKADPARYRRLARAVLCSFRSFRYGWCAKLAGEVPEDGTVTPEVLALFPPDTTPASLRRLAAEEADRLPRDDEVVRLLRRVTGL